MNCAKKHCCAALNHRSLLQVCHTKKKCFKRSAGKQPYMQTRGNRAIVEDLLLWSLKDASLATIVSVSVYEEPSSVPSETKGLPGSEGKKQGFEAQQSPSPGTPLSLQNLKMKWSSLSAGHVKALLGLPMHLKYAMVCFTSNIRPLANLQPSDDRACYVL